MPAAAGMIQGLKNLVTNPGQTIVRSVGAKHLMGITHDLFTHPGHALRAGWDKTKWYDKAMIAGAVAPDVISMAKPSQPGEPGRMECAGRALGTAVGGVAFQRHPGMLGNAIGWTAGSEVGKLTGRVAGKITGIGKAKPPLQPGEEPSLHDKLFNKAGAAKKLKDFTRKKIREARFQEVEPNKMGDIATATWRDPTGTYERISATENKPHA